VLLLACATGGLLAAGAVTVAPDAIAQVTTPTTTDPTATTAPTTTTAPPPTTTTAPATTTAPRPNTIPAGVTIGGILVGGLSPLEASETIRSMFARPLTLKVEKRKFTVDPRRLGAAAYTGVAVKRARISRPGANVPLKVRVTRSKVERYVREIAGRFAKDPVDARLSLRNLKPFVSKDVPGKRLQEAAAVRAITNAVKTHDRGPLNLELEPVRATATRADIGEVIVIRRGTNKLFLYDGMKLRRTFQVATGQSRYPTPLGRFEVVVKWKNPWWYPPDSDWAKDAEPIPPGAGNPLGTRWMGISSPAVGIHGTPDSASIGYSVSHGCIRMHIPDVEWLFERVDVGTPVFIVSA
jgi:lipoprotein-anchoring transpeptidase ErfK/SrfK